MDRKVNILTALLHRLVEHSSMNGDDKAAAHAHIDAMAAEPEAAPEASPEDAKG